VALPFPLKSILRPGKKKKKEKEKTRILRKLKYFTMQKL
jgi:hypothetical protein